MSRPVDQLPDAVITSAPDLEPPDDDPPVVFERRVDEYIDDEEQELLDAVAEAINDKLVTLGIGGHWLVDAERRTCRPAFLPDFGEIVYPIASDDGQAMQVILKIDCIFDRNAHLVEKREEL